MRVREAGAIELLRGGRRRLVKRFRQKVWGVMTVICGYKYF